MKQIAAQLHICIGCHQIVQLWWIFVLTYSWGRCEPDKTVNDITRMCVGLSPNLSPILSQIGSRIAFRPRRIGKQFVCLEMRGYPPIVWPFQ